MQAKSRWQIWALLGMSLIGIGLGIWLSWAGFTILGCLTIAVFLWRAREFSLWLIVPVRIPEEGTRPVNSLRERAVLSFVCLAGAAVCALGVYIWRLWPEEWQAGFVFILFGLLVLAPVTLWQVQLHRRVSKTRTSSS